MSRLEPHALFYELFPEREDPDNPGQYLCRFCGKPTTETRRRYYCSDHCYWMCQKTCSWPWVRREVWQRDGKKCRICGVDLSGSNQETWDRSHPERELGEVHHIIPVVELNSLANVVVKEWGYDFNEDRRTYMQVWARVYTTLFLDPNNLITLCFDCHNKVHAGEIILEPNMGSETTTAKNLRTRWWAPQKTLDQYAEANVRE